MSMHYDGQQFTNISATTAPFQLQGGLYGIDYIGTWGGGSVTLEKLAGDGSTYIVALTAFTANGVSMGYLPSGTYKFVVATATGVYLQLERIFLGD
jgi:hypothetical protein